ncbi:MAG: DUF4130 domain-containing protein [Promethearchaeota archaeon]
MTINEYKSYKSNPEIHSLQLDPIILKNIEKTSQSGNRGYTKDQLCILIRRHSDFSPQLVQKIMRHDGSILQNSGSPFAKHVNGMIREVFKEFDRQRQFTRTELTPEGILWGKVHFEHRIEDLVLNYFHDRFPQCIIVLANEVKKDCIFINEVGKMFGSASQMQDLIQILSEGRPQSSIYSDLQYSNEDLFDEFYSSQFIKNRKNKRYFRQMIPLKAMKLPGMRGGIEVRYQNNSLDKFLLSKLKTRERPS